MPFTPDTGLAFRSDVDLSAAKDVVLRFHAALDAAPEHDIATTIAAHCAPDAG